VVFYLYSVRGLERSIETNVPTDLLDYFSLSEGEKSLKNKIHFLAPQKNQ